MTTPGLKKDFDLSSFDPAHCVHLIIDVQKKYCASMADHYAPIAHHIDKIVAPAMRDLGVLNIWIWMLRKDGPIEPDFFCVTPHEKDCQMAKMLAGAFYDTPLDQTLKDLGIKTVILSGFYYPACVLSTALGGVERGYNVIIMPDCTDRADNAKYKGSEWSEYVRDCGITEINSTGALSLLSGHKNRGNLRFNPL